MESLCGRVVGPGVAAGDPMSSPKRERATTTHTIPTTPSALAAASLGALGVVYGDIGTSPLYAFRECVHGGAHAGCVHIKLKVNKQLLEFIYSVALAYCK